MEGWLIDRKGDFGIRGLCLISFGLSDSGNSKSVAVLAFLRSEKILVGKIGLSRPQATVTMEKINLKWQIQSGATCSVRG